ncbi:AmmeMemoRadiSam system protein B [Halioxenophilus sp. WMMB6]|uniref:AmmeMemoRadiSam system protein B n=1 Tax=Halioxenophilus sp. WMMB6 TaxID=3073815 RepID=UPI00295F414E|nr:AmmeMemoRadiSam system protein B [Halioxenophilus sp. WMMB6]
MATSVRPSAIAGQFYPADAHSLAAVINHCLQHAKTHRSTTPPQAIITPHAGLIYSGPTAAVAWSQALARTTPIQRVVLLGPSHRVGFSGVATSPAQAWRTPLGEIALDREGAEALQSHPFVQAFALAHAQEHCLEVQVPFIQTLWPKAKLLPLLVGDASAEQVAALLAPYWGDPETLIAISSDLSHFHDYATAQAIDQRTAQAIEAGRVDAIGPEQACGCRALNGLLLVAGQHHRPVVTLELCNSGDTAGDRSRVVGYGAFAVH